MAPTPGHRQTLIFDGDDTLWENNVYFERAIDEFIAYLDHSSLAPPEVRAVLDEIERANTKLHGYGSAAFGQSLRECYEHLRARRLEDPDLSIVMGFAERLRAQPMELIAGVEATLDALGARHDLMLLTKGTPRSSGSRSSAPDWRVSFAGPSSSRRRTSPSTGR